MAFVIQTFLQSLMLFWNSSPLVGHLTEGLSAGLVSGIGVEPGLWVVLRFGNKITSTQCKPNMKLEGWSDLKKDLSFLFTSTLGPHWFGALSCEVHNKQKPALLWFC